MHPFSASHRPFPVSARSGLRRRARAGWARLRRRGAPAPPDTGAAAAVPAGGTSLWRMRTTVPEAPGSLAVLCTALASRGVDILSLQTHPLGVPDGADGERTLDEFLLRAPECFEAGALRTVADDAGGSSTWVERADAHDLVDTPARVLELAARTAQDSAELPLALRQLLGRCTVRSVPARTPFGTPTGVTVPAGGALEGTVLRLPDSSGGVLVVERPHLPFTPAEFARARALAALDARLGGERVPAARQTWTPRRGEEVTLRRAGPDDLAAAAAMQQRCSRRTLTMRYHGSAGDSDSFLAHLLSPRFGRTLVAETASGRLVALGHLLWDGEESEVALLVEDAWQRRGIGGALLRRLTALAAADGTERVYAVVEPSNTAMAAAMRGLRLPLEHQLDEGTRVITAAVAGAAETGARRCADPAGTSR